MWEEVENRKTNKTGVEKARRKRGKGKEKTNDGGRKNNSKNSERKGE